MNKSQANGAEPKSSDPNPQNSTQSPFDPNLRTVTSTGSKKNRLGERTGPPPHIPDHKLLRSVGRGSYGEVWLARNVMGVFRAVKIVYRDQFDSDRPYEREFSGIQQFEPISRTDDCQVDILHIGRNDDEGYFYYVMELADSVDAIKETGVPVVPMSSKAGSETRITRSSLRTAPAQTIDPETYAPLNLREVAERWGRIPIQDCLEIAIRLTTALEHLHENGLVHRDVKPSNIIFVNGIPKLADIGLVASTEATLSFVGTEGFLPPEGPGKPQADIYGLGKALYEIATGRDRQEYPELPSKVDESDEAELFELNEVIVRACDDDVNQRYASAREMREDLFLLQAGKSLARSRWLEKRLSLLGKWAAVVTVVVFVVFAGFLYQRHLTEKHAMLAELNQLLLASMHEKEGLRLMEAGDWIPSLLWFAKTLQEFDGHPDDEGRIRLRVGSILQRTPRLVQLLHDKIQFSQAQFHPREPKILTSARIDDNNDPQKAHVAIKVWNLHSGAMTQEIRSEGLDNVSPTVWTVLSSNGERAATWSLDNKRVHLWDLANGIELHGSPLQVSENHRPRAFSPDGNLIASSGERTVWIWQVDGGILLRPLEHEAELQPQGYKLIPFSPNGTLVATMMTNRVASVWDVTTGQCIAKIPIDETAGPVGVAAFSPDSKWLATKSSRRCDIWEIATGKRRFALPTEADYGIEQVRFSPNGKWIVTTEAGAGHVRVWATSDGRPVTDWLRDRNVREFGKVIFGPDSKSIMIGGWGALRQFGTLSLNGTSGHRLYRRIKGCTDLILRKTDIKR